MNISNSPERVDVVFRDFIERTENLSVVISDLPENQNLTNLGASTEVGYRFRQKIEQTSNLNRKADLINLEKEKADRKNIAYHNIKLDFLIIGYYC